jgi:hypothetical protein
MKNGITLLFLFLSFCISAQLNYQGNVKDSKTKQPIPFCAIAFKDNAQGCISNEEGVFQLNSQNKTDTLLISCIGYKRKRISLNAFLKDPVILLEVSEFNLQEVVIYDKDDFLFEIFESCRKKIVDSKQNTSKTYFVLESFIAEQAVELLECYYNSSFNQSSLRSLDFKNGRVGMAPYNDRFFVNVNISKAFTFINLIGGNSDLPKNPFEYSKRQLKKTYRLKFLSLSEDETKLIHLEFNPIEDNGDYFSGEVWIEQNTGLLQKVSLRVSNTRKHPFLPLFKGEGSVDEVSLQINKSYFIKNGDAVLEHIDFNYQLLYHHPHNKSLLNPNKDTSYRVSSKGLMHFYDHDKAFIIPYFYYDKEFSDYKKIASLSYNEGFWTANTGIVYSQNMKKGIQYFKKNGFLLNFQNGQSSNFMMLKGGKFFENNYLLWSEKKRISLKKDKIIHDTISTNSSNGQTIRSSLYQIKAQMFLDLNPMADSIQHYSAAVFDVYETFYNLPEEPETNCFINIYFDLFEIERRKMEKTLSQKKLTAQEMDVIYKKSIKNLEIQSKDYFSEVERGKKLKALEKWNLYVKDNLGIDNFEIFQILSQKK